MDQDDTNQDDTNQDEPKSMNLTKIDRLPEINLIIQNDSGTILGLYGGHSRMLAELIETSAQDPGFPIRKMADNFMQPGQDVYSVTVEYFLAIRGTFIFMPWARIKELAELIPSDAKISLVISY